MMAGLDDEVGALPANKVDDVSNNNISTPLISEISTLRDVKPDLQKVDSLVTSEISSFRNSGEHLPLEHLSLEKLRKIYDSAQQRLSGVSSDGAVLSNSDDDSSNASSQEDNDQNCGDDSNMNTQGDLMQMSQNSDLGSSTTCSTDSFELGSSSDLPKSARPVHSEEAATSSQSDGSSRMTHGNKPGRINPFLNKAAIEQEVGSLDTGLPDFDFDKLEKSLASAAQEQQLLHQQKLLNGPSSSTIYATPCYPPTPTKRPKKSNLATRLQSGMNLQICYLNDTAHDERESDKNNGELVSSDSDDESDDDFLLSKSKSTPDLKHQSLEKKTNLGRSVSNCSDSSKRASELRKQAEEQDEQQQSDLDFEARRVKLEAEAKVMLAKAKQAAQMQMEVEKQKRPEKSYIEEVVGFPLSRKRLNRAQLTKMNITQLQIIVNDMHTKIEGFNAELVELLIERDSLHMEQDSMLVDIEDLIQHKRAEDLKLPEFLIASPQNESSRTLRFRIFKR